MNMNELEELLRKSSLDFETNENLPFSFMYPFYSKVREKELSHSEILKCFLNPNEDHEHNSDFLKVFFLEIGLKEDFDKLEEIDIYTEFGTKATDSSNSRPIDIFITYKIDKKKYGIIIENKLNNAIDQPNQINDYYDGILNTGYYCSKVVYMHINPLKKVESTDTRKDILEFSYNYDVTKLISSLASIKQYSYIKEYQHLLIKIRNSFMDTINSTQIQKELTNGEVEKLIKASNLVNSESWNKAKHNRILEKIGIEELKSSYEKKYSTYYFKDYKFWVEIWYYSDNYKLWLCSYSEELEGVEYSKWGWEKGRYFFKVENNEFKYPSDEDRLIEELKNVLLKSR